MKLIRKKENAKSKYSALLKVSPWTIFRKKELLNHKPDRQKRNRHCVKLKKENKSKLRVIFFWGGS